MRDEGPDGPHPTVGLTTLNGYCFPRRPNRLGLAKCDGLVRYRARRAMQCLDEHQRVIRRRANTGHSVRNVS
jgi:hypothetical protein